jgi:hypothetical protein
MTDNLLQCRILL